jgi:hypothetical protein
MTHTPDRSEQSPGVDRVDSIDAAAVVDLDEFQEARQDGEWQETLAAARAYRAQLELEGRNR